VTLPLGLRTRAVFRVLPPRVLYLHELAVLFRFARCRPARHGVHGYARPHGPSLSARAHTTGFRGAGRRRGAMLAATVERSELDQDGMKLKSKLESRKVANRTRSQTSAETTISVCVSRECEKPLSGRSVWSRPVGSLLCAGTKGPHRPQISPVVNTHLRSRSKEPLAADRGWHLR